MGIGNCDCVTRLDAFHFAASRQYFNYVKFVMFVAFVVAVAAAVLCKCQQLIRESEPEASRVSFNVSRCSRMVLVVVAVSLVVGVGAIAVVTGCQVPKSQHDDDRDVDATSASLLLPRPEPLLGLVVICIRNLSQ